MIEWCCAVKEKPFLFTIERFNLQASCMQKQFNFLNYLHQEYDALDFESIIVCKRVSVTSRLWSLELLFNPQ